jgi:5-formyltetrahydrofolate cyclo-ligase
VDFRQTASVVPSPSLPLSKEALRSAALEARKAFVRTIDDASRALLEQKLAENLTSLCASARVVAG